MSVPAVSWAMSVPIRDGRRRDGRRVKAATMRAVLVVLAEHAHRSTDRCHPSWDRIVQRTGLARSTVVRALAALEHAELLVVVTPPNAVPGRRSSTVYALPVDTLRSVDNVPVDNLGPVSRGHSTGVPGTLGPVSRGHPNRKGTGRNRGALELDPVDYPVRPSLPAPWLHHQPCACAGCRALARAGSGGP